MLIQWKKVRPNAKIPLRTSDGAVGFDAHASIILDRNTREVIGNLPVVIEPGEAVLIGIGVQFAVPFPVEVQVRPRSGLASKYGVDLLNSPGTIDPDFRGEAGVLLRNTGSEPFKIESGMRIAQLIFNKIEIPFFEEVDELPETVRGAGGFGSTGLYGVGFGTEQFEAEKKRWDLYFLRVAEITGEMSNCVRGAKRDPTTNDWERDKRGNIISKRKFGCIIVSPNNQIIAAGFNSVVIGADCLEKGCMRDRLGIESGTQIEKCNAIHAEQHALSVLAMEGSSAREATVYITAEPCEVCSKLLVANGVSRVVCIEGTYPNNGLQILKNAGVSVSLYQREEVII